MTPFFKIALRFPNGSSHGSATVSFRAAKKNTFTPLVSSGVVCAAIWRPVEAMRSNSGMRAEEENGNGEEDEGHMLHACAALGVGHVPSPWAL